MKHFTTKFLAVCAFIAVAGSVQAQVFYQQQFNNPGLPAGWTTTDPSGNGVLWARCVNQTTDCHTTELGYDLFAGTDKANGFMVLDSDGAGDLGNSTHQSRLTTAAIDCSGKSTVFAVFEHQIGVYDYVADDNAKLFVSNNGTTWTPYQLFTGIDGAGGTRFSDNPTLSGINISAVAANQATVYLRWEWIGNFEYWWTLDNVQLTTQDPTPANDLAVSDFIYSVSSYATPESQIGTDTLFFEASISNNGTAEQTNVKMYAYVLAYDDAGALLGVVHIDSTTVPSLAAGVVDSTFTIGNLFAPELPVGLYSIAYEITADSADQRSTDNFDGDFFRVTDLQFAKENGPQSASRPADGGDWAVGNYYRMGPGLDIYKAAGAEFSFAVNAPQVPGDINVEISLYRLNDDTESDFSNFEPDGSSMTLVGISGFDTPDDAANYDIFSTELVDLNSGDNGIVLDPNGRYILAAGYAGDGNRDAFTAFNSNVVSPFVSTILYIGGEWGGNFTGRPNAVLRMYLELFTTADNSPLEETTLSVSPNPTSDYVNLKMKFDQPTDATITIADINGRVLRTDNRSSMVDETVNYSLNQFASGTYLARIATAKGTRTLKFVVQK